MFQTLMSGEHLAHMETAVMTLEFIFLTIPTLTILTTIKTLLLFTRVDKSQILQLMSTLSQVELTILRLTADFLYVKKPWT